MANDTQSHGRTGQHLLWILILSFTFIAALTSCATHRPPAPEKVTRIIPSGIMEPLKITYIGHATLLIEIGDRRFLTDPVFSHRIATQSRKAPPGIAAKDLPPLHGVLVSHGHYDHLDVPSLQMLDPKVPILIPPRATTLVPGLKGRTLVELAPWKSWKVDGITITAVPARHFGGRYLVDSMFRPAVGYVIQYGGQTVYFAGDTAYSRAFKAIGAHFDIDAALLPIGAYRPRWMMFASHMGPGDALNAFQDLGADYMIPMHWGTFKLSLEPLDEPIKLLKEMATQKNLSDRIIILNPGHHWSIGE